MKILLDSFAEGNIDKVYLASNKFVNTMTQQPEVAQLLPLGKLEEGGEKQDENYELDDIPLRKCQLQDIVPHGPEASHLQPVG